VHPKLADEKYISRPPARVRRLRQRSAARQVLEEKLGVDYDEIDSARSTRAEVLKLVWEDTQYDWRSARMDAFIDHITKRLKQTDGKVLVFDESHRALIVASNALSANDIEHYFIHGDIGYAHRKQWLDAFKDPTSGHRVLLMTIKCGGTGLNGLTVADTVYFLTMTLSPWDKAQAKARAVRVGNQRPVLVVQFYTNHSIERRVLSIQAETTMKADNMLDQSKVTRRQLDKLSSWDSLGRFEKKVRHHQSYVAQ
jgi:SNF2 family DNA or RNA helicase